MSVIDDDGDDVSFSRQISSFFAGTFFSQISFHSSVNDKSLLYVCQIIISKIIQIPLPCSMWVSTLNNSPSIVAATWIPRVTGSISIISSGTLIYMMVADREWKLTKPNHRILLMMSVFDTIVSAAQVMSSGTY